ncbi:MAG: hypothetical protein PXX82_07930 [Methanomassiliicoccales archaeon]|nr:hypothetical protein [Methanomassiliicoccales archaeon]
MGWDDNVDGRISTYWERREKEKLVGTDTLEKLDAALNGIGRTFIDATQEHPVPAIDFCSWLDCAFLIGFFRGSYTNFSVVEKRLEPRIRFFAFLVISRSRTLIEGYRSMCADDGWRRLGFTGKPTYELLREFVNERIGDDRFQLLFDALLVELCRLEKALGVEIGGRVGNDGTDGHSLKHDSEAKYSGYYKHNGWKADVVHDMDDQSVTLHYTSMEITESEGCFLIPSQKHLYSLGVRPKVWKVDGGYTSYANIAHSEINGTHLVYRIEADWKINPKGTQKGIKRLYQRYRQHEDFNPYASAGEMLNFLYDRGEYEAVGAYFRNMRMDYAAAHPEEFKHECGERSGKTEGQFGVSKSHTLLDSRPVKRGRKAFDRTCHFTFIAGQFASVIRAQHGVRQHLGCLTYITA